MSALSALRQMIHARVISHLQNNSLILSPSRNIRAEVKVKWVRPPKVPSYLPCKSGDLSGFVMPDGNAIPKYFNNSKQLLKCTNEHVRKVFSLGLQSTRMNYMAYQQKLVEKVKSHKFDSDSLEVQIAVLTSRIRWGHHLHFKKPSNTKLRCRLNRLIRRRRKALRLLRTLDYRKFEWLLEKLDIKFQPQTIKIEKVVRKNAVKLLAELKREKLKEEKLAEHKKKLDNLKVPFLKKKLQKLLWIKEQETAFQLEKSVTESDIEECRKQIEKVTLQVEENRKNGYLRKVHPYTLEVYTPEKTTSG